MREIRQRKYDGWYAVWEKRGSHPWQTIAVFSERENAAETFINGPGWPFHANPKRY